MGVDILKHYPEGKIATREKINRRTKSFVCVGVERKKVIRAKSSSSQTKTFTLTSSALHGNSDPAAT